MTDSDTAPATRSSRSIWPTTPEVASLFRIAAPMITVQVGLMLMGVVDTLMVGRVSAVALGAVALGNMYFWAFSIPGQGALLALDPIISQAVGAGDERAIRRGVQRSLLIALVVTVPVGILMLVAEPVLRALGQPEELIGPAAAFARLMAPGLPAFFGFVVLRQTLQSLGLTRAIVIVIIGANVLNFFIDWVLIYGHLGAPALGVVGSAWATTLSRWVMTIGLGIVVWPRLRHLIRPWLPEVFERGPLLRMLSLGIPIGWQLQLEYLAFGGTAILMGRIGTPSVAGHQIALNLSSLTYMVPLGVSSAAAVVVGQSVGRRDEVGARRSSGAALLIGGGFMLLAGIVFLAFPGFLVRLYTRNPDVYAVGVRLMPLAGLFQVFDGLQVVSSGVLRGLGDTKVPMVINLLGYWVIGIPLGLFFGFYLHWQAVGLWWGLVVGLVLVAVALLIRVRRRLRKQLRRVVIDHDPIEPAAAEFPVNS